MAAAELSEAFRKHLLNSYNDSVRFLYRIKASGGPPEQIAFYEGRANACSGIAHYLGYRFEADTYRMVEIER